MLETVENYYSLNRLGLTDVMKHDTTIISDTGVIRDERSNDEYRQTLLIKRDNVLYQMDVRCQSYEFQSHALLSVFTKDKGWVVIQSYSPQKHFELNISYKRETLGMNVFEEIFQEFARIIMKTHGVFV